MEMKCLTICLLICAAAQCFGFEDFSTYRPIHEKAGFWDGRKHFKPSENQSDRGSRITNGQIATPGQFPYMVFVAINTEFSGNFQCGGSIINQQAVLTGLFKLTIIFVYKIPQNCFYF